MYSYDSHHRGDISNVLITREKFGFVFRFSVVRALLLLYTYAVFLNDRVIYASILIKIVQILLFFF